MNKKSFSNIVIITSIFVLFIVPRISNATSPENNDFITISSTIDTVDMEQYASFCNELDCLINNLDEYTPLNDVKIELLDKISAMQEKYNNSPTISYFFNKLITTIVSSSFTSTKDLLNSLSAELDFMLENNEKQSSDSTVNNISSIPNNPSTEYSDEFHIEDFVKTTESTTVENNIEQNPARIEELADKNSVLKNATNILKLIRNMLLTKPSKIEGS